MSWPTLTNVRRTLAIGLIVLIVVPSWLWSAAHGPLSLAWDAVTTAQGGGALVNPIAYYNVRWGTTQGQQNSGTSTTLTQFTIKGLDPNLLYWFVITAVDTAGIESAVSNEVSGRPTLVLHQ